MRWIECGRWMLTAGALAVMWAGGAHAAPVTFSGSMANQIPLTGGLGTTWTIGNAQGTSNGLPTGGTFGPYAGLGVLDGVLAPGGTAKNDPFDNGLTVWVDDVQYVSPDSVDVTGAVLTSGPVTLSGLGVTVQYAPIATSATLRTLVSLHNPTGAPIDTEVKIVSNFGSDGATQVIGTSSGDTTIDTADHWSVTSDNLTTPADAVNVQVFAGPRAITEPDVGYGVATPDQVATTVFSYASTQGLLVRYPVHVLAGETVYVLVFHELAGSNAEGLVEAPSFDTDAVLGSELLAGMTADQLLHVVNWNFFGVIDLVGGGGGSGTVWSIWNSAGTDDATAGGVCEAAPAFAIGDVQYDPGIPLHLAKHDALDNGLALFVDGTPFVSQFDPPHSTTSVTAGPQSLSGLDVTMEFATLSASPTLRARARFTNPSGSPITAQIRVSSNLGSNGATGVRASSDGNTTLDASDRWVVTSDDGSSPTDPVVTQVVRGPGSPPLTPASLADTTFSCRGNEGLDATFALTVPAGASRALLFFDEVHATNADAVSAATAFDTTPAVGSTLVAGLDAAALAEVANWNFCGETAACDDGNACTTDGCGAQGGCVHAPAADGASFVSIGCRIAGLIATAQTATGKSAAAIVKKVQSAKTAVDSASNHAKKGPARKQVAKAIKALKGFEGLLRKKGAKAGLAQATIDAATATSAGVRTDLGTLKGQIQ